MNRTRTISFDADFSSFNRKTDEAASRADKALNRASGGTSSGSDSDIQERASEIFKQMAQDAEARAQSQSEANRLIREEISLLSQANRLEEQRARTASRERLEAAKMSYNRGALTKAEYEKEQRIYRQSMSEVSSDNASNRVTAQYLRNFLTHYQSKDLDDKKEEYDVEKEGDVDRKKDRRRGGGDSGASAFGYALLGGAAGAFGLSAFMGIQSFISKIIHDAEKLDISRGQFMGLRGQQGKLGLQGLGEAAGFGLSNADFMTYSKGVGTSIGSTNFGAAAINQLAIEKRFGLEDGSLNQLNEAGRMGSYLSRGRVNIQDSASITEQFVRELKSSNVYGFGKGDFSMLGEKLDDLGSVMENVGENIEGGLGAANASNLISAFSRVGGSFSDQRQVQSIGQIDKAIRNPGNEFSQALMFRAIRSQDPNMSLFEIMKRQEQGATPENITAIMDILGKGEKNENTYFNVAQALGLRLGQAENLTNSYLSPDGAFREDLNTFDLGSSSDTDFIGDSRRLGKRAPGSIQQFSARVENLSASKGSQAIAALQPVMEVALDAVDVAGDILVTIFKGASTLVEFAKKTTDAFEQYMKPLQGSSSNSQQNNQNNTQKSNGLNQNSGSPGTSYIDNEILKDIRDLLMEGNRLNRSEQMKSSYWNNMG